MQPSAPRVVLITGASGGLGRALVAEFLAQGWGVAAGYHSENVHQAGDFLLPLPLDVTSREAVQSGVAQVLSRWPRLDLLINNTVVAQGEVVLVNERYGIRLTRVVPASERMKNL